MDFSPTDPKIRLQSPEFGVQSPLHPSQHPNARAASFSLEAAAELRSLFLLGGTIKQLNEGEKNSIKATRPPWKTGSLSLHVVVTSLLPRPQAQKPQFLLPKHLEQPGCEPPRARCSPQTSQSRLQGSPCSSSLPVLPQSPVAGVLRPG